MNWLNICAVTGAVFVISFLGLMKSAPRQQTLYGAAERGRLDKVAILAIVPLMLLTAFGPSPTRMIAAALILIASIVSVVLQHRRLIAGGMETGFVWRLSGVFTIGVAATTAFVMANVGGDLT